MQYKTVYSENIEKFDEKCNALAKEGWQPTGNIVSVAKPGTSIIAHSQQWSKEVEGPSTTNA